MNRKPLAALQQLKVFEGSWQIEGKNFQAAPDGHDQAVHGKDSYEWLDGNFFMISHWQHLYEGGGHKGVSLLGFDESEQKLFTRGFDNLGFERKYIFEVNDRIWNFIGDKERAKRTLSEDGRSYTEHWEIKDDNGEWKPLCIMNGTKQ